MRVVSYHHSCNNWADQLVSDEIMRSEDDDLFYEGWNFNSGNYLFTTDTK